MVSAFYAYPSRPTSVGDSVTAAIDEINGAGEIKIMPWSKMAIGGKLLIREICDQIDASQLFFADLTDLNPNVLFELGYAIAKDKRVWLTLDSTFSESNTKFSRFGMLTTIGYTSYVNSLDIVNRFYQERPHEDLQNTILNKLIVPNVDTTVESGSALLYLKSKHETEASLKITKRAGGSRLGVIIDDPRESPVRPLTWYGSQVYQSTALLCHITDPSREGAAIYNARSAFVAGMAHAMHKPVLMLVEGDYLTPLDYRELALNYRNASHAAGHLETWLSSLEDRKKQLESQRNAYVRDVALKTQLKGLRIGDYIAENESDSLVENYFVETTAYSDALAGQHSLFVGRKGSGKSATFFKLTAELGADKRNVVTTIKPVAYDIQAVVRLLAQVREKDVKGFAMASLWKFLLLRNYLKSSLSAIKAR